METPTLSLIMPCYKYGHFLPEAMESVAKQSVKPHEIIIINDGSPDNTSEVAREMIAKYPELNIILLEKENGGLSSARNAGIAVATGKYIMSFDADDILRPDAVKEHLALAEDNTIVTLGLTYFGDETGTFRPTVATIPILLQTNVIYSNSLFPRKAWEDVGGFDESPTMRYGWEDREFWLRCLGAGYKSVVGDYIGLLYRRHALTMSSNSANPHAKELQDYIYNKNKHLLK
jgi:glycosyltransferase involved in cell wall biosynthesis